MQHSFPVGGLSLYRAGVEPAGSRRKVSSHSILLSTASSWRKGIHTCLMVSVLFAGITCSFLKRHVMPKGLTQGDLHMGKSVRIIIGNGVRLQFGMLSGFNRNPHPQIRWWTAHPTKSKHKTCIPKPSKTPLTGKTTQIRNCRKNQSRLTRRDKQDVKSLLPATNYKAMIAKSRHRILIKIDATFSA